MDHVTTGYVRFNLISEIKYCFHTCITDWWFKERGCALVLHQFLRKAHSKSYDQMIKTKSAVDDSSLENEQKGSFLAEKWKRPRKGFLKKTFLSSCPLSLPMIYSDNKVRKYQKVKWKEARLGGGERVCPTIQNVPRHQKYPQELF